MNSRTSAMHRTHRDRDRAVTRLQAITIGTGVAGLAAVGGFGAIAAASYDGTSTTGGVTTAAVTTETSTSTSGASSATPTTTSTTTTSGSSSLATTAAPTTSTGTAHASTGSS